MPDNKVQFTEFAAKIKEKYPQYADVDDYELASKIVEKYPAYKDSVQLPGFKKFKLGNDTIDIREDQVDFYLKDNPDLQKNLIPIDTQVAAPVTQDKAGETTRTGNKIFKLTPELVSNINRSLPEKNWLSTDQADIDRYNSFDYDIARAAAEKGEDPDLIKSIWLQEHRMNKGLTSGAGYTGLPQTNQATIDTINKVFGENYTIDQMNDPYVAARFTADHLRWEKQLGGKTPEELMVGYNRGPAHIESYRKGLPLPEETSGYLKNVGAVYQEALRAGGRLPDMPPSTEYKATDPILKSMQAANANKGIGVSQEDGNKWQGFGSELVQQLKQGTNSLVAGIYEAPAMIYDFVGSGFRALGMNVPTWDKSVFTKDVNVGNVDINPLSALDKHKNILVQTAKQNADKVKQLNPDLERGVIEPFSKGDIQTGIRNMFSSMTESAPASAAMMLTGGLSVPSQVGLGAAVFGGQNVNQADQEGNYGNLSRDGLLAVSAVTGAFESIFETTLGSGAVGKSLANIIQKTGRKQAAQGVQQGFRDVVADMITKNPWMAPFGEGFEEIGTQVSQNLVNKFSGYQPDINVMDGVWDAGIIGIGMGAVHGGIIGGAKKLLGGTTDQQQIPGIPGSNVPGQPAQPGQPPQPGQPQSPRNVFAQQTGNELGNYVHKSDGNLHEFSVTGKDGTLVDKGLIIDQDNSGMAMVVRYNPDGTIDNKVTPMPVRDLGDISILPVQQRVNEKLSEFDAVQAQQQAQQQAQAAATEYKGKTVKVGGKEYQVMTDEVNKNGIRLLSGNRIINGKLTHLTGKFTPDEIDKAGEPAATPENEKKANTKPTYSVKSFNEDGSVKETSEVTDDPQGYFTERINMAESLDDLKDLAWENDTKLDKLIEKKFPQVQKVLKIGNEDVTKSPGRVRARIEHAKTIDQLNEITIQNYPELESLLSKAKEKFTNTASNLKSDSEKLTETESQPIANEQPENISPVESLQKNETPLNTSDQKNETENKTGTQETDQGGTTLGDNAGVSPLPAGDSNGTPDSGGGSVVLDELEQKKADIEKRRQEELDTVSETITGNLKGETHVSGWQTRNKRGEQIYSETKEGVIDKINAKYDAELSTLNNNQNENKEGQTGRETQAGREKGLLNDQGQDAPGGDTVTEPGINAPASQEKQYNQDIEDYWNKRLEQVPAENKQKEREREEKKDAADKRVYDIAQILKEKRKQKEGGQLHSWLTSKEASDLFDELDSYGKKDLFRLVSTTDENKFNELDKYAESLFPETEKIKATSQGEIDRGKNPWEMTKQEYADQVYAGNIDFERINDGGSKNIQVMVSNYHDTTDPQNKEISRTHINNDIEQHYHSEVVQALMSGKITGDQFKQLRNEKLSETTGQNAVATGETVQPQTEVQPANAETGQDGQALEQEGLKRVNPTLYKLAQKATTVGDFINSVAKANSVSVKDISTENLTEFYNRVEKPKSENTLDIGLKQAEDQAATSPNNDLPEPTEAQKKAGNYTKGHYRVRGFGVTIENPSGSTRTGKDTTGKEWETTMNHSYGYFKKTVGAEGDNIDLFMSKNPSKGKTFIIDQVDPNTGEFDEHKVMMGFNSEQEARDAYLSNYEPGWKGLKDITEVTDQELKSWLNTEANNKKPKRKPYGELAHVKEKKIFIKGTTESGEDLEFTPNILKDEVYKALVNKVPYYSGKKFNDAIEAYLNAQYPKGFKYRGIEYIPKPKKGNVPFAKAVDNGKAIQGITDEIIRDFINSPAPSKKLDDKHRFEFNSAPPGEYTPAPIQVKEPKITEDNTDARVNSIAGYAAEKSTNPTLTGVYKNVTDKELVATDGYKVVVLKDETLEGENTVIYQEGKEPADLGFKYPDYKKYVNEAEEGATVKTKPIQVKPLLEKLRGISRVNEFFEYPVVNAPPSEVKAMVKVGKNVKLVNPGYFADALEALYRNGVTEVELGLNDDPDKPMFISNSDKTKKAIVLPFRYDSSAKNSFSTVVNEDAINVVTGEVYKKPGQDTQEEKLETRIPEPGEVDQVEWVKQNRDELVNHYIQEKGNIIDPDEVRLLLKPIGYTGRNVVEFRDGEKYLVNEVYTELLKRNTKAEVYFLTGIPGAGKSTVQKNYIADKLKDNILFDSTLPEDNRLLDRIEQAKGRKVLVYMVHTDPREAFIGTLKRAVDKNTPGRAVTLSYFLHAVNLLKGRVQRLKIYDDQFKIINFVRKGDNVTKEDSDNIGINYETSFEELKSLLDNSEYLNQLTDEQYRTITDEKKPGIKTLDTGGTEGSREGSDVNSTESKRSPEAGRLPEGGTESSEEDLKNSEGHTTLAGEYGLQITYPYEKAFIVTGDTKPIAQTFRDLGAKWNFKEKGWMFPLTKENEIRAALGFDVNPDAPRAAETKKEVEQKSAEPKKITQTPYSTEGIDHEQPHYEVAKRIKKAIDYYVKDLAEKLGWEFDTDKKGKPVYANANIAPAGGDVTFILWKPGSEYGVYVSIPYSPDLDGMGYDNYHAGDQFLWRITTKKDKYRGLGNRYAPVTTDINKLAQLITDALPNEKRDAERAEQELKFSLTDVSNGTKPILFRSVGGVDFKFRQNTVGSVSIDRVFIPEENRGTHLLSNAIAKVVEKADNEGITLTTQLSPDDNLDLTYEKLRKSFGKNGFLPVEMDGEKYRNDLIRKPKNTKEEQPSKTSNFETGTLGNIRISISRYGWDAKKSENGGIILTNRNGKEVGIITGTNQKYTISHLEGDKILTGNKDLTAAVEKTLKEYWFVQEQTKAPAKEENKPEPTKNEDKADVAKVEKAIDLIGDQKTNTPRRKELISYVIKNFDLLPENSKIVFKNRVKDYFPEMVKEIPGYQNDQEQPQQEENKPDLPDGWDTGTIMKARYAARQVFTTEELDKMRNEDTMDWGDQVSIVRKIKEKLGDTSAKAPTKEPAEPAPQKAQEPTQEPAKEPTKAPAKQFGAENKLVTVDRAEELKRRLKDKLKNLNVGIDPEVMSIGTELAVFYIEGGTRKFADFVKVMVDDIGDAIKPYLKSFYNGARDLPGMEGYESEMDDYPTVKAANIDDLLKQNETETSINDQETGGKNDTERQSDTEGKDPTSLDGRTRTGKNERTSQKGNSDTGSSGPDTNDVPGDLQTDTTGNGKGTGGGGTNANDSTNGHGTKTDTGTGDGTGTGSNNERSDELKKLSEQNFSINPDTFSLPAGEISRIKTNIRVIKLLKKLQKNGKQATPAEKELLAQYVGWGGLAKVFDFSYYDKGWRDKYLDFYNELKTLLTEEEFREARASVKNAHYTDTKIIRSIWDIIQKMGFKSGNILEPSGGIGHFFGVMPQDIMNQSNLYGYELDPVTGGIFKLLYPQAKVRVTGYENAVEPNNSLDLVISNVPFGDYKVHDKENKDLSKKFNIHNYFIAKSIRKLKPGGLGVFITSSWTMDSAGTDLRTWVTTEGNTDFMGAIRLPNTAFKGNAGTEVTTDILIFRKRTGQAPHPAAKPFTVTRKVREAVNKDDRKTYPLMINEYYADNPEMMLGEMVFGFESGNALYGGTSTTMTAIKGSNLLNDIQEAAKNLPSDVFSAEYTGEVKELQKGYKVGQIIEYEGGLALVGRNGELYEYSNTNNVSDLKDKKHPKKEVLTMYNSIKEAASNLVEAEMEKDIDENSLNQLRKNLNTAYDNFVKVFGEFYNNNRIQFLKNDVDYHTVAALEKVKESFVTQPNGKVKEVYEITKADIFNERVNIPVSEPESAANVKDAANISMFYKNSLNVPYMAKLLKKTEPEVEQEVINEGIGFIDPKTGLMVDREEYLSGNVVEKLDLAKAETAKNEGKYDNNVKELEAVQPKRKPITKIAIALGNPWIPKEIYREFIRRHLEVSTNINYFASANRWVITPTSGERGAKNTDVYGVHNKTGVDLVEDFMNGKDTEVLVYDRETKTSKKNPELSLQAQEKQDQLNSDFKSWILKSTQHHEQLEDIYNRQYNNIRLRKFEIPDIKEYPGTSPKAGLKLWPHRIRAISRALREPTLIAHEVGTGKTFTLIVAAMEMRRLKIAKKPMIVVQKSTVGQFTQSFKDLYPQAKLLVSEKESLNKEERIDFWNKIIYNDWDAIVIHHNALDLMPDDPDRVEQYIQERIDQIIAQAEAEKTGNPYTDKFIDKQADKEIEKLIKQRDKAREAADKVITEINQIVDNVTGTAVANKQTVKQKEKKAAKIKGKILSQADRRVDNTYTFEKMGIDALLIDEAHRYKRLGFVTNAKKVKGIDTEGSQTSMGILLKTKWILQQNNNRNVVFATGTPISNTMAEVWTLMRYLIPDKLTEYNITEFDQFKNQFGDVVTDIEFTAGGQFKNVKRFSTYVNLMELQKLFRTFADIELSKNIDDLKPGKGVPLLKDGKYTRITIESTPVLKAMTERFRQILYHFEHVMKGKEKMRNRHIPLMVFNRAKQAAIDARLVDSHLPDDPNSKLNVTVRNVAKIYKETSGYKGTQIVFCDMYQSPDHKFNLFEDIREKLINEGIPENEIAIATNLEGKKLDEAFNKVKSGDIRIVMGGTQKLGTGVNIQDLLYAVHHMDAPPRPMDFTQRNGRILRQGNKHLGMNKPVEVATYGVEKTLDATAYQRLDIKSNFIRQLLEWTEDSGIDSIEEQAEDIDGMTFSEMMATLSGSQHAIFFNKVKSQLKRLDQQRDAYNDHIANISRKIRYEESYNKQKSIDDTKKKIKDFGLETDPEAKFFTFQSFKVGNKVFKEKLNKTEEEKKAEIELLKETHKGEKARIFDEVEKLILSKFEFDGADHSVSITYNDMPMVLTVHMPTVKEKEIKTPVFTFAKVLINGSEAHSNQWRTYQTLNGILNSVHENITDQPKYLDENIKQEAKRIKDIADLREELVKPWPKEDEYARTREEYDKLSDLMQQETAEKPKETNIPDIDFETNLNVSEDEDSADEDSEAEMSLADDTEQETENNPGRGFTFNEDTLNNTVEVDSVQDIIADYKNDAGKNFIQKTVDTLKKYSSIIKGVYVPHTGKVYLVKNSRVNKEKLLFHEHGHRFMDNEISPDIKRRISMKVFDAFKNSDIGKYIQEKYKDMPIPEQGAEIIMRYAEKFIDNDVINPMYPVNLQELAAKKELDFNDLHDIVNTIANHLGYENNRTDFGGRNENIRGNNRGTGNRNTPVNRFGKNDRGSIRRGIRSARIKPFPEDYDLITDYLTDAEAYNNKVNAPARELAFRLEEIQNTEDANIMMSLADEDELTDYDPAEYAARVYSENKKAKKNMKDWFERMRELHIDNAIPIRRHGEMVVAMGGTMTDDSNPYRDLRNSFGRAEELYRQYAEKYMEPIIKAVFMLEVSGISRDQILPYMVAKSGLERNQVMRADEFAEWENDHPDATEEEINEVLDSLSKKDYSGVGQLAPEGMFETPDEAAQALIDQIEGKADPDKLQTLWDAARQATKKTLDHWEAGGQFAPGMKEFYENRMQYFLPLRGWRHGASKELDYHGKGGKSKSLVHAEGRTSLPDNPLAYMQAVAFKAIREQVDNEVKTAMFNLVKDNYEPKFRSLHKLKKAWLVKNWDINEETQVPEEVWSLYRDENGEIAEPPTELIESGEAKQVLSNQHERLRASVHARQHEVIVRKNGEYHVIVFEGENLKTAQALNGSNTLYRLFGQVYDMRDFNNHLMIRAWGNWTNFMKRMFTQLNPVFPLTNLPRDTFEGNLTQLIRGKGLPAAKAAQAAAAISRRMRGKEDLNNEYDRKLAQFYESGAATGFTHEKTPEQIEREIIKSINHSLSKGTIKGLARDGVSNLFGYIEQWNRWLEDTTRYSVFLKSLDAGMTVKDAAYQARTATVDFNMKGILTPIFEIPYAFFKVAMSSLQKNLQLAKRYPKAFIGTSAAVVTLGFIEAMLNSMGDDDDELYKYSNISEYARMNYLIFKKFWGKDENKYLRIPLPQFWRGFHALGVVAYNVYKGDMSAEKAIAASMINFTNSLSPIDIGGFWSDGEFSLAPLTPTAARPVIESYITNRDFMGRPIAQEAFTKKLEQQLADSGLHKKNVNAGAKLITDLLFRLGGGEGKYKFKLSKDGKELQYVAPMLDQNPSKLEHLVEGYFGGTGRFVNDLSKTLIGIFDPGEPTDIDNIPVVNSFIRNTPQEDWEMIKKFQGLEKEFSDFGSLVSSQKSKLMSREREPGDGQKFRQMVSSKKYRDSMLFGTYQDQIDQIVKTFGMQDEKAKTRITGIMRKAVNEFGKETVKQ